VGGAILHPPAGKILIVEVAPLVKTGDGVVNSFLAVATASQPVPHFPFRASPIGEKGEGGIGRPGALVVLQEPSRTRCIKHVVDCEVLARNQISRQGKCERPVDLD
jgi:hypothetical protein